MIKSFSHQDIENWAVFSGDRNKVHFDRSIATKNGLKDIIVQGMLVMLDTKLAMSRFVQEQSSLSFGLKTPVLVNTGMEYETREKNNKIFSTVSVQEETHPSITASMVRQPLPVKGKMENIIHIAPDFFKEQIEMFRGFYPAMTPLWLMLDALLFSACFKYQKYDPFDEKAEKITTEPDKSKVVTYQVDQKIFISDEMINIQELNFSDFTLCFEDKDIISTGSSVYSALEYQVLKGDNVIYQSGMGSITRAASA